MPCKAQKSREVSEPAVQDGGTAETGDALEVLQLEGAALEVVLDAPRGADDHVAAAAQHALLGPVGRAAVQADRGQGRRAPDELEVRVHLGGSRCSMSPLELRPLGAETTHMSSIAWTAGVTQYKQKYITTHHMLACRSEACHASDMQEAFAYRGYMGDQ